MAKVAITDGPLPSPCWVSSYASNGRGYTYVNVDRRKVYAHRLSYEHHVGPIPAGLQLDHLCRTPACCNPAHLEPVTSQENQRRAIAAGSRRIEQCKHGHSLDDAYINKKGHRSCRTCARAAMKAYDRTHPGRRRIKKQRA